MKRWKIIGLLVLVLFLCWFLIEAYWGGIDISGTLKTQYLDTENRETQIISTDYFDISTPKNWIHVFNGHGLEGDPFGMIITNKGIIHYEYGNWAGEFSPQDSISNEIYNRKVVEDSLGRFFVNISFSPSRGSGLSILPQQEMTRNLIFYEGDAVSENLELLKEGVKTMKFRK